MYKHIFIKFGLWLGVGIFLMFYGISHSLALTYTNIGEMRNVTQQLVSTNYGDAPFNNPVHSGYAFNEVLQVSYIISNYNFEANKNYQLESHLSSQHLTNANSYSVQGLNGENCLISYENSIFQDAYPRWAFQCPHATNQIVISIRNSSNEYLWSGTGIFNWETALLKYSDTSLSGSGSDTDNIINNQNQNTQNIINNQNQNNQAIIDNNNQNTDRIIEDNKKNFQTCRESYNLLNISSEYTLKGNKVVPLNLSPGTYTLSIKNVVSDNVPNNYYLFVVFNPQTSRNVYLRFDSTTVTFNLNFTATSFRIYSHNSYSTSGTTTTTFYNMMIQEGNIATDYEPYGEEICVNKLDEQNNAINGLNDSINDDDTTDAKNEASDFFSSFTTNTFGLTSIITAPLNLIQSLTSSTCSVLHLPLPYLNNKYLDLPCMTSIYQSHFGTFFTMYQTITYGIIAYWICVRIFNQVKDFKNPEHDEIEVVDL